MQLNFDILHLPSLVTSTFASQCCYNLPEKQFKSPRNLPAITQFEQISGMLHLPIPQVSTFLLGGKKNGVFCLTPLFTKSHSSSCSPVTCGFQLFLANAKQSRNRPGLLSLWLSKRRSPGYEVDCKAPIMIQ